MPGYNHTPVSTTEKGVYNFEGQNLTNSPVKGRTPTVADLRNDWLLYTIPGIAFAVGFSLFIFILMTQRPRQERVQARCNTKDSRGRSQRPHNDSSRCDGASCEELVSDLKDDLVQTYSNVEIAIYNNQEGATFYLPADDGSGTRAGSDAESYENMDACVYAQPRRQTKDTHTNKKNDYVDPDTDPAQDDLDADYVEPDMNGEQEVSDTESYERMASQKSLSEIYSVPRGPNHMEETPDDDSYERMEGVALS